MTYLIESLLCFGVAAILYNLSAELFEFPRIRSLIRDILRNCKVH